MYSVSIFKTVGSQPLAVAKAEEVKNNVSWQWEGGAEQRPGFLLLNVDKRRCDGSAADMEGSWQSMAP